MRVFARRERPHPGAQLTLFETAGRLALHPVGHRTCPPGCGAGGASCGYIDAAHRVHARVEDCIRTGKDAGSASSPRIDFADELRVARPPP